MRRQPLKRRVGSGIESLEPRLPLAASLLPRFIEVPVASGIITPTAMAIAPDGRIFINEKSGDMRVVKNGALLAAPFVELSVHNVGERGLLGVALDPDFENNNYVYAYYTTSTAPIHNRVSRFTANGDVAVPGSEMVLLDLETLSSEHNNHNGGAIHFGLDDKLYIAVGENATTTNSQTLTNRLGKVLRINSNGTIPNDNPFVGVAGAREEIWALGLRNPFSFAVQPGTGTIFINDVGAGTWEEINPGSAGANYGWPNTEGPTNDPNFVSPLFAYQHFSGTPQGRAITGGTFYNPATVQFPPQFVGDYFFSDYLGGFIWRYDVATDTAARFATEVGSPVDLQVTADGDLLYLDIAAGQLRAIRYADQAPNLELGADAAYTENANPVVIAPAAIVEDVDSPDFFNGLLRVGFIANAQNSDRLTIANEGNISISGNSVLFAGQQMGTFSGGSNGAQLVVQLLGAATPARVQALLRNVTYHNISENPSGASRTVRVLVNDGDGEVSIDTKQINITPVNDQPGLAFVGGQLSYQLNQDSIRLAPASIVTDADSPNFNTGSLIVEITGGGEAGNRLEIRGGLFSVDVGGNVRRSGVVIGTTNTGGGVGLTRLEVTFNAQALPNYVQQLVRAIRFRTVGSSNTGQRSIDFTVNDGDGADSVTRTVTVDVT